VASAHEIFPLAEFADSGVWLGRRPCLPDMLPIVGPAPRHRGLWLDFGHHHLGLTLGPVTGRLLAEMMTGEAAFTDPAPYRADRF
jgi:D-amino-acid dehydrogenase